MVPVGEWSYCHDSNICSAVHIHSIFSPLLQNMTCWLRVNKTLQLSYQNFEYETCQNLIKSPNYSHNLNTKNLDYSSALYLHEMYISIKYWYLMASAIISSISSSLLQTLKVFGPLLWLLVQWLWLAVLRGCWLSGPPAMILEYQNRQTGDMDNLQHSPTTYTNTPQHRTYILIQNGSTSSQNITVSLTQAMHFILKCIIVTSPPMDPFFFSLLVTSFWDYKLPKTPEMWSFHRLLWPEIRI